MSSDRKDGSLTDEDMTELRERVLWPTPQAPTPPVETLKPQTVCSQCCAMTPCGDPCRECGNVEPETLRNGRRYKIVSAKDRDTIPVMPWFEVPRSVARKKLGKARAEIGSRMIHLQIPGDIIVRESRIKNLGKRHELWYRVAVPQSGCRPDKAGWINAVAIVGCMIHGAKGDSHGD